MKELSDYQKSTRENNDNYFRNGKPKKGSMLCRDKSYQSMIRRYNGYFDINWTCAGNSCPLYAHGCDNRGLDWEN